MDIEKIDLSFPCRSYYVDSAEIEVNIRGDLSFLFNLFVWQMVPHRRFYTFVARPPPLVESGRPFFLQNTTNFSLS